MGQRKYDLERYDLETVKYRAPLLWTNLREEHKTATSKWKWGICVCQLCQTY